jgi:hypothetical protein
MQRNILGTDLSYIQPSAIFAGPCPSSAARLRAHSRTAGDFNATASLIDVFVTLLGILSLPCAPLSLKIACYSHTTQLHGAAQQ